MLVLVSHLGRPKDRKPELSLRPVADRLAALIGSDVTLAPAVVGEEVRALVDGLRPADVLGVSMASTGGGASHVERHTRDLAEPHVLRAERELAFHEAHRGAAVTAATGLEEHERPLRGAEAMNHLERRGGGRDGGVGLAAVARHF